MPARTNACATCRKKRIKCDATFPQCLMCIKSGRQCPGPGNGPVIIDMTAKAKFGAKRRKGSKEELEIGTAQSNLMFYSLPQELMWGIGMQMSQRHALVEVYYSNFLAYFTSTGEGSDIQNKQTWLHKLPDLSTDGTNSALTLALHATSSAFSGMKTKNSLLIRDAIDLYGKALHQHSYLLQSKKTITVHMVSTSVLLGIFESMNATSASAYRAHINGAAKMVRLAGTEQCLSGVLCQIYFHIRTQMVFVYLTTTDKDKDDVPAETILRESLGYRNLPVLQRLMSFVMQLAEIYVSAEHGSGKVEQAIDLETYLEVKGNVNALWFEYQEAAAKLGEVLSWTTPAGELGFRDAFTALCIAYFNSARILFSILAPRLAVSYLDFTDYYESILNIGKYLTTFKVGCAFMRMATPLFLVASHAPKKEQRRVAIRIFEEWKGLGMGGISALALDRIHSRAEEKRRTQGR